MIRPGRQPRPDSACHSSDVLTPTECAADRVPLRVAATTPPKPATGLKWADDPDIRTILQSLRGKL